MRMIGRVGDERGAAVFGDYLVARGIENMVRAEQDGTWGIWVYEESKLPEARELLAGYQANPGDPIYRSAVGEAQRRAAEQAREDAEMRARTYDRQRLWAGGGGALGPFTVVLIALSVGMAIFSKLGRDIEFLRPWFITDPYNWILLRYTGLPEVAAGEWWRVITPIFIHFGFIHILFNMMWTRDLGGMIERARGTLYFAVLVLVIGAAANLGEYFLTGFPRFGGMSGVVYGLAGYAWMQGRRDPGSGVFLSGHTMKFLLIWFVICLTGLVGPIANVAHGVGLVSGVLFGVIPGRKRLP